MKQVIKKLCQGNAESYLKWKIQLGHVLKNRLFESFNDKLNMVEAMLDGDLLESWKLWRKNELEKEKEGTFKKETGEVYKKKYVEGDSDGVFKYCSGKVSHAPCGLG